MKSLSLRYSLVLTLDMKFKGNYPLKGSVSKDKNRLLQ